MRSNNLKIAELSVRKQELSQNIIWKINYDSCTDRFKLKVDTGCMVVSVVDGTISVFNKLPDECVKRQLAAKEEELYGVDITAFDLVCGVYDVKYKDNRNDNPTNIGIYANCRARINKVEKTFEKFGSRLDSGLCKNIGSKTLIKEVCDSLKIELRKWLFQTVEGVTQKDVNRVCAENRGALYSIFEGVLDDYGLEMVEESFNLGDVKFDRSSGDEKENKSKLSNAREK